MLEVLEESNISNH